jgi:hypothetical protein
VQRFENYYRVWTPVSGLRWDIILAVEAHRNGNEERSQRYAYQSLYFYAKFRRAIARFVEEHGGLWLFPSVVDETRIANAVWEIGGGAPFIPVEDSRLKLAAASGELSPFVAWLQDDGSDLLDRWAAWLKECLCKSVRGDGRKRCPVHVSLRATRDFYEGVNRQWDEIADWYKIDRPPSEPDAIGGRWREAPGTRNR